MLIDLIEKNRSYRRFDETVKVPMKCLQKMIDAARLSASARNSQPLKYFLSNEAKLNSEIFTCLAWAGYIKDWSGPSKGERPSAYIIQMNDTRITSDYFCDDGIAIQSIALSSVEQGFGGCIIASVKKEKLAAILNIPNHLKIVQVFALGKPIEKIVIENIQNDDVKYWRDENHTHHVPKRKLDELIFREVE